MTLRRAAAIVALALVALVAIMLVVGSGSSDGYKVVADVENAGQLIPGNEVRIGAATVGSVSAVRLTSHGTAEVEMNIDSGWAPLPVGTEATIRAGSVIGLANRYIELAPPGGIRGHLPSGAHIGLADTTSPVEFDQFLDAFDAPTRAGLQSFIKGEATIYQGHGADAARALHWLGPALSGTAGMMGELARDQAAFEGLIRQGSVVARAVSSRRADLVNLISGANATFGAAAEQETALNQAIGQLPSTLRRADTTFVHVRSALDQIDPLVATAKPATRNLAPYLAKVKRLMARARPSVPKLSAVINTPGKANDLRNLFGRLPALSRVAGRALPDTVSFMNRSEDVMAMFRAYTPDLFGAISNLDQASSYYDVNGHYLRAMPAFGALHYDNGLNQLEPQSATDRLNGFELGDNRCPGSAVQPPPDGSAPISIGACNPLLVPPGP
jgi:phospholipid/cholesterol/gamma-HCH transport system substrate-binding protein